MQRCLKNALLLLASLSVGCLSPRLAIAQVTTNNALPLGKGQGLVRVQFTYLQAIENGQEFEELSIPVVFGFGATRKLALFAVAPILKRELNADGQRRSNFGLGDIELLARYTIFQQNQRGQTFRIAPIVGLEVPTGRNQASDELGVLPQSLQLGSGSFDPSLGFVITRQSLKDSFSTSFTYQFNNKADDFERGDEATVDVAYKYRIFPEQLKSGFLFVGLESNLSVQGRNRIAGTVDPDSGGTRLFISPSVQYITPRFTLEGAVQIPLVQDISNSTIGTDIRVVVGGQVNF